jgi:putative peptidoglycan lipid II flippase
MAGAIAADPRGAEVVRHRLGAALRQVAFLVVPSSMVFLALGDIVAAALLQTGRFTASDSRYVWGILAGSAIGLLASTLGRLYSSTYYALRDTRTPLRFAVVRVGLTTALGYFLAVPVPRWLGVPPLWGAAGLTASAGIAGWVEMLLLRRVLNARIGWTGLSATYLTQLWFAAGLAAAAAWAVRLAAPSWHPLVTAALVLGSFGIIYFTVTLALRLPEAAAVFGRFSRRR